MSCSTHTKHNVLVLDNELGMGGSEKLLFDFLCRFDRERFNVEICCLKEGGYWKERIVDIGVPFHEKLLGHRFDFLAFRRLAAIIRAGQIDIIDTYVHPNTVIFAYFAKVLGLVKRFVVAFHATGNPEGGRLVPGYLRPFLQEADALIALAEPHRRYLTGTERLHDSQIEIIHNGVDTERFRPASVDERASARREFGFNSGDFVVATVASLKPAKRIDHLLESIAPVIKGRSDLRLLIVGDGPDRASLESLANALGIAADVTFAGIRDDVDCLLRMSDALVLSSRPGTETFPTVVLEAMSTALPVVTTDVGSVREMVEQEKSAVIVPPENPEALRRGISMIVGNRSLASAYGQRGREIATQKFSVDNMCSNRQRLFDRLLAHD